MLGTHLILWRLRPASHYDQAQFPHLANVLTAKTLQDVLKIVIEWCSMQEAYRTSVRTMGLAQCDQALGRKEMGLRLPLHTDDTYTQRVSQEALGSRSVLHMADVLWACLLTCGLEAWGFPHSVTPGVSGESEGGRCILMGTGG